MTRRVALLRGINLGSHKKVPMAQLRELATDLGLDDPATYVQSGNLVFDTGLAESEVVSILEAGLADRFGFEIPVISRSADEIERVADGHPLSHLELDDRLLQVAFMDREPSGDVAELIDPDGYDPDEYVWEGREIYIAYPKGSGRSKLNHSLLERRLSVAVTLRNWRTVAKLAEMAASPDD